MGVTRLSTKDNLMKGKLIADRPFAYNYNYKYREKIFYIMISGLAPESAAAIDLKLLRLIKHTIDKEYTYAKKPKCTQ